MLKSAPIQDGDFVIVILCGDNKGQAAVVTNVIKTMADVYFPLRDVQKTLRLTSLHNRHPSIEGHRAF
jgi:ribosomal protein L24